MTNEENQHNKVVFQPLNVIYEMLKKEACYKNDRIT